MIKSLGTHLNDDHHDYLMSATCISNDVRRITDKSDSEQDVSIAMENLESRLRSKLAIDSRFCTLLSVSISLNWLSKFDIILDRLIMTWQDGLIKTDQHLWSISSIPPSWRNQSTWKEIAMMEWSIITCHDPYEARGTFSSQIDCRVGWQCYDDTLPFSLR